MKIKRETKGVASGLKFGFELEFTDTRSSTRTAIVNNFRANGLSIIDRNTYAHSSGSQWELKLDGSAGSELASRILMGEEGIAEARKATELLHSTLIAAQGDNPRYGTVNTSCGMHVHVDVSNLSPLQLGNVLKIWHKFEPTIFGLVPDSRRNNSYCRRMRSAIYNENDFSTWAKGWGQMRSADSKVASYDRMFGRCAVNLGNYHRTGTIEFRLWAGTTNSSKVIGNILFCLRLIDTAINAKKTSHTTKAKTNPIEMMLYGLNLYGPFTLDTLALECRSYIRNRWNEFGSQVLASIETDRNNNRARS